MINSFLGERPAASQGGSKQGESVSWWDTSMAYTESQSTN